MITQTPTKRPFLSLREPICSLTHLSGAILSLAGMIWLLILVQGDPLAVLACSLYGGSLIFLFLASALSHSLFVNDRLQMRLCQLDYIGIFMLIAGSTAPFCLITLRHDWGIPLLIMQYSIAVLGSLHVLLWPRVAHIKRAWLYIVQGWLVLVAARPLLAHLPFAALVWLFIGGVIFTVGAIILALDRPHLVPGKFSAHDLWHFFVLAGCACHFYVIVRYIAMAT